MIRHTVLAISALLIAACANIEHKSPQAKQQIKQDLNIASITATSTMSFSWHRIASPSVPLKYIPGIGILTPDSLLLVDYENGKYVQKAILKTNDVRCISDGNGQTFTVFTKQLAVSLIPYGEGTANNPIFRTQVIKLLTSKSQPYLQGDAAAFIRKTDRKDYSVSTLSAGGTTLPIVVGTDAYETYDPCPNATQAAH